MTLIDRASSLSWQHRIPSFQVVFLLTTQSSNRLSNLPQLNPPTPHLPHLPPRNRHHLLTPFSDRKHNTKFIPRRTNIIIPLIPQTDHNTSNHIANSEALSNFDLVNLRRPDILLSDLRLEGFA